MKSECKNKNNHGKIHQKSQGNTIIQATDTFRQPRKLMAQNQEQVRFHLHDEQPQSINAKRKLEQFSISLNQQKLVNLNQRNHHTTNLLKKKTLNTNEDENQNIGWTDNQIIMKQQSTYNSKPKQNSLLQNKKIYSSTRNSLPKTIHVKQKIYDKKLSSFTTTNYSPQKKLNLSFNNLIPGCQMETIREQQISKQIIKKVKNSQSKRPNTASYYAASQKILTLFDKDKQSGKKTGQTMRIHSVKDSQLKMNNPSTLKNRQRMLKTCNSFYINDKNILPQQKNYYELKKQDNNKIDGLKQKQQSKVVQWLVNQSKQKINKHKRTYSEPVQVQKQKKIRCENNEKLTLSHRKYQMISDKKNKRGWGFNGVNRQLTVEQSAISNRGRATSNKERATSNRERATSNRGRATRNRGSCQIGNQFFQNSNNAKTKINSQPLPQTTNNLQEDFTLLTNLLRQQNQHIFGGQLHSYLTQVKNNYQYNYYMSSTINKKHHSRNSLNQSLRLTKNKTKIKTNQDNSNMINSMNGAVNNDQLINKNNNTTRHYRPFSSSKHKTKTNNFLISSSNIL